MDRATTTTPAPGKLPCGCAALGCGCQGEPVHQARALAAQVYDPAKPAPRDYENSGNFVHQELPTIQAWRDLVPFLALGDTVTVRFYCEQPDVADRVHQLDAALDPEANRGYARAEFSLYGGVWLTTADGQRVTLIRCRECGSPWGVTADTGYGNTFDCPDCNHHSYSDRGD